MLVGDASIVGAPDEDGDTTDVPQVVVDLLTVPLKVVSAVERPRRMQIPMDDLPPVG